VAIAVGRTYRVLARDYGDVIELCGGGGTLWLADHRWNGELVVVTGCSPRRPDAFYCLLWQGLLLVLDVRGNALVGM
jgi:hypothetical protein